MWPTPNVPNRGPESRASKAKRPQAGGIDLQTERNARPLQEVACHYSRPRAVLTLLRLRKHFRGLGRRVRRERLRFLHSVLLAELRARGKACSVLGPTSRPTLNPNFVEWLNGWPPGLTACDCSATAFAKHKALWRSLLCWLVSRQDKTGA